MHRFPTKVVFQWNGLLVQPHVILLSEVHIERIICVATAILEDPQNNVPSFTIAVLDEWITYFLAMPEFRSSIPVDGAVSPHLSASGLDVGNGSESTLDSRSRSH